MFLEGFVWWVLIMDILGNVVGFNIWFGILVRGRINYWDVIWEGWYRFWVLIMVWLMVGCVDVV